MRRFLLAAPWVLLSHVAPLSTTHAAAPVSECVQVEPETVAAGMSLHVVNTCEFTVRCALTWRVRCEDDAPDAPTRDRSVEVRMTPGAQKTLLASGEACGALIWEITDDTWECQQVR